MHHPILILSFFLSITLSASQDTEIFPMDETGIVIEVSKNKESIPEEEPAKVYPKEEDLSLPGIKKISMNNQIEDCLKNGGSWTLPHRYTSLDNAYCQYSPGRSDQKEVYLKLKDITYPVTGRLVQIGNGSMDWILVKGNGEIFKLDGSTNSGFLKWTKIKGDLKVKLIDDTILFY